MRIATVRLFLIPLLAAGALGFFSYYLSGLLLAFRTGPTRALAEYRADNRSPKNPSAVMGSRRYRIGLAFSGLGFQVEGHETAALYLAYGVVGIALAWAIFLLRLPIALWLAAPFLAYLIVNAHIESKWTAARLELEKELPACLLRIASTLQASPNLIQGLDTVAEGLDPEKPLQGWMHRLARELQSRGKAGLDRMQAEAGGISASLLLAVVEIGRLWETGGQGYTQALKLAAGNLADLLETRSQAQAVAAGAWSTARTILLALSITLGATLANPVSRPAMHTPLIQITLLLALVWGGLGYQQIKSLVDRIVE